jgi:hypothetical protein
VEALERQLGGDLGMVRDQRLVGRGRDQELMRQPLEVLEDQRLGGACRLVAGIAQASLPEVERLAAGHPPDHAVHHARARASARDAGVLEERDVRPWFTGLVRVKQVVHGGLVLVDRLLHEPQTENPRVEVHVALGLRRDCSYVVDAFELHRISWFGRVEPLPTAQA